MIQWGWNYFTHRRSARLITGKYLEVLEEMEGIRMRVQDKENKEPVEVA